MRNIKKHSEYGAVFLKIISFYLKPNDTVLLLRWHFPGELKHCYISVCLNRLSAQRLPRCLLDWPASNNELDQRKFPSHIIGKHLVYYGVINMIWIKNNVTSMSVVLNQHQKRLRCITCNGRFSRFPSRLKENKKVHLIIRDVIRNWHWKHGHL